MCGQESRRSQRDAERSADKMDAACRREILSVSRALWMSKLLQSTSNTFEMKCGKGYISPPTSTMFPKRLRTATCSVPLRPVPTGTCNTCQDFSFLFLSPFFIFSYIKRGTTGTTSTYPLIQGYLLVLVTVSNRYHRFLVRRKPASDRAPAR
jgi:hypothetical protein